MCDCSVYKLLKTLDKNDIIKLQNFENVSVPLNHFDKKCSNLEYFYFDNDIIACGHLGIILKYTERTIKLMTLEALPLPGIFIGLLLGYTGLYIN